VPTSRKRRSPSTLTSAPIITRGNQITQGIRPLDPQLYRAALDAARKTPYYSSRRGAVLSADTVIDAAAGEALGTWSPLGPNNQGGRIRQLLIDPTNPSTMYTAAVGGGVWKTTDAGATWNQLTDLLLPNVAVAALAMEPGNPQVLYAGTGEGFYNVDAIRGAGVFKSTDGGATWSALAATTPAAGSLGDFSYVTQISTQIQSMLLGAFTGVISVFDAADNLLETHDLSGVSNESGDGSAIFLGIVRASADIDRVALSVKFSDPGVTDLALAINQLDFGLQGDAPEPATLARRIQV
jgi:hypothetical protein